MAKKVDQTKIERIRNASVEVISEHGILGGSVASIAERADVSVGYLYRHYPGKTGDSAEWSGCWGKENWRRSMRF